LEHAAGADLPDAYHLVLAARDGVPAVGGEGQAEDLVAVPLEDAHGASLAEVPQVQVEVAARREGAARGPAGGGHEGEPAVGGEGGGRDAAAEAVQAPQRRPGRAVPDPQRVVGREGGTTRWR